jgi:hypothetical protein
MPDPIPAKKPLVNSSSEVLGAGTGRTPVIPVSEPMDAMKRTAPPKGGAVADSVTLAGGDGFVAYRLEVPDLSDLLLTSTQRRVSIQSATVKVYLDVGTARRTLHDLADVFVVDFAEGATATINRNVQILLDKGPRPLGRNWTVTIEATLKAKPKATGDDDAPQPVLVVVECELPVTVGSLQPLTAP